MVLTRYTYTYLYLLEKLMKTENILKIRACKTFSKARNFISAFLLLSIASTISAADKSKEVDMVYSKLISALPVEGEIMTSPYADSLGSFGEGSKAKFNKDSDAIGGVALEIQTKKGRNPWDSGVFNKIGVPIKKGDVIYMAFFAKAIDLPKGKQVAELKNAGIQKDSEPYTTIVGKDIELTTSWQSFAMAAVAPQDFSKNDSQVQFQVGNAKQKLAFGPVFVFNLGPDVDPQSLPYITR